LKTKTLPLIYADRKNRKTLTTKGTENTEEERNELPERQLLTGREIKVLFYRRGRKGRRDTKVKHCCGQSDREQDEGAMREDV
jgi:hypothetical protein